ncbi:antirestriction protein ArdA [Mesorhizobium sp. ORM6]
MRFYAACLASYNNGVLYGRWIDASDDVDAMQAEINAMLRESRFPNVMVNDPETSLPVPSAEEWAIHDSEGLGDIGEYAGLAEIARRAAVAELADEKDIPLAVLLAFASDHLNGEWDSADLESEVDDRYRGSYDTWRDFAQEFTEETNDMNAIPQWLKGHIDWDSIARDFELSGDFSAYRDGETGSLYLFWAC